MKYFEKQEDYRLRLIPTEWDSATNNWKTVLHDRSGVCNICLLCRKFCKGKGLDVGGAGFYGTLEGAVQGSILVDPLLPGTGDAYNLSQYGENSMDYVIHSHCLEHLDDPERAIE